MASLIERLKAAGDHYGIPVERDFAEAALEIQKLREALTCVDARLQMLGRDAGNGTVYHAVVALRDLIARATS